MSMSTQPTDHSIPSNNIPLRHFIEQLPRRANLPILRIHVNQRRPENHSLSKSNPFHLHKLMNPFPKVKTTRPSTRGQHRRQGRTTGLKALPNHLIKKLQSLVGAEILSVPTNHRGPETRTFFVGNFIEHAAGIDAVTRNGITPNQSVSHVRIGGQPELDDVDEEGEGVFAGGDAGSAHGEVEGERVGRVGMGANEGVPHEGVGAGGEAEDSGSVGEVAEGGEGAGGEQAADGEGVGGGDGGNHHLSVNLLQLLQGGAFVGEECQRGEAS
ncbi:hypothetical protein CR513_40227, partial [Mucuna pruriens]